MIEHFLQSCRAWREDLSLPPPLALVHPSKEERGTPNRCNFSSYKLGSCAACNMAPVDVCRDPMVLRVSVQLLFPTHKILCQQFPARNQPGANHAEGVNPAFKSSRLQEISRRGGVILVFHLLLHNAAVLATRSVSDRFLLRYSVTKDQLGSCLFFPQNADFLPLVFWQV